MKNSLFVILIIIIVGSIVSIIYKKRNRNDMPESTIAAFNKKLIDVGDRKLHSKPSGEFIIVNSGKNNLIIKSVEPDCHCTVPDYTKTPVKPGDSSKITLIYDSANPGVFQSSAMVKTNSSTNANTILILRGNIIP